MEFALDANKMRASLLAPKRLQSFFFYNPFIIWQNVKAKLFVILRHAL